MSDETKVKATFNPNSSIAHCPSEEESLYPRVVREEHPEMFQDEFSDDEHLVRPMTPYKREKRSLTKEEMEKIECSAEHRNNSPDYRFD